MEARTGGPSSIGRPKPSSTRPRRPGPTRNNASSRRAITRSPGCNPSISSSGIDNTRSLRNPITCDRIERPEAVRTSTKSPIDTTGPRDAMSSPTISVTSPIQGSTSMPGTCGTNSRIERLGSAILALQLVDQSALDFAQLRLHRRVQDALRGFEENFRGFQIRIRRQRQILWRAHLLQQLANQRLQCWMHAHAVDLARLQFRKRSLDQPGQRIRIHGHFAMNHAPRNRRRQVYQVLNGFLANAFAQTRQRVQRIRQPLHGGTKLILRLLPSSRQTFGVSVAPRLIQFARRFALRIAVAVSTRIVYRSNHAPQYWCGGRLIVSGDVASHNLRRHIRRRRHPSGSACLRFPTALPPPGSVAAPLPRRECEPDPRLPCLRAASRLRAATCIVRIDSSTDRWCP